MSGDCVYLVHDQAIVDAQYYGVYDDFEDAVAKAKEEAKKTWCAIPVRKCEINTENNKIVYWATEE